MSNAILNRICNDENDPMLGVKICCKHGDLLSMQTSWSKDNLGGKFWSCPRYRVCTFLHLSLETSPYFIFLNLIFFVFVILTLANIIKELEIDDENHIKRSNKCVIKEKKKTKYCNNWKLIFMLFVVFFFFSIFKHYQEHYGGWKILITYESNVATDDSSVATDASNAYVATDDPYIATYDIYVAIDDPYVATYETYVATYETYFATYETYVTSFDQVLALNITSHT
ncbi:hypothetical protein H5410_055875, partial [Solanum commersonii]